MDSEDVRKPKSSKRQRKQKKQKGNQSWDELDGLQEGNLQQFASQRSSSSDQKKETKPKVDRKAKKASEIEQYQKALARLRSQNKMFHKPFDKQRLNLSTMQAIKMLKDAIERDKDFTKTLRNMGCKTRMRARNKTAARELFGVMLKYLQQGMIPEWMRERHKELLLKDDGKFDNFMRVEQKDWQ